MSEPNKQPGMAFWATLVVVVMVLAYPFGYGPVEWLYARHLVPRSCVPFLNRIYRPMLWMRGHVHAPKPIKATLDWYVTVGIPSQEGLTVPVKSGPFIVVPGK